jgi:hypothetical protein
MTRPKGVIVFPSTTAGKGFIVYLPGASLLHCSELAGKRLRVECPGCGAVQVYRPRTGPIRPFQHLADDCPTLAQIDARALLNSPQVGGTH